MKTALVFALLCSGAVFASAALQPPAPTTTAMPVLGTDLAGTEGHVDLVVAINDHGFVTDAEIKSASDPRLARACLDAIRRWRYSPALDNGRPVATRIVQPIHFSDGLITSSERQPTTRSPRALRRVAPTLPDSLRHVTGHVVAEVRIDAEGRITSAVIDSSTHEELKAPTLAAVRQWTFAPAIDGGSPVPTTLHVPFNFVGDPLAPEAARQAEVVPDRALTVLRRRDPALPAGLENVAGEAEIAFIVDAFGFVVAPEIRSASHPAFGEAARAAVLDWKYRPARRGGQPVPVRVVQPFRFHGGLVTADSRDLVDKLPAVKRSVEPVLPPALAGIAGRVLVEFSIDAEGNVLDAEAKDATVPELAPPVLAAARQWKFRPALKDGQPAAARVAVPFVFGR